MQKIMYAFCLFQNGNYVTASSSVYKKSSVRFVTEVGNILISNFFKYFLLDGFSLNTMLCL